MALCEAQLDSAVSQLKEEETQDNSILSETSDHVADNSAVGQLNMPLGVDYTSPRSHFIPPEVEMYSLQNRRLNSSQSGSTTSLSTIGSNTSGVLAKRKRGRPRIDKTSPEYLAKSEERRQAREMASMMNNSGEIVEKKKRGRPRIDKTSPEYLARKHAKELEALEKKAQRQYKRRGTADSAASSSAGEGTSRVKRKYTKRAVTGDAPAKRGRKRKVVLGPDGLPITPQPTEKVKGKRGRPRKDASSTPNSSPNKPLIRVRSNLMPENTEPIPVDSDDEGDLGSPGNSESLSFDDNLRALRHLHEKYANIGKDENYSAHLLSANVQSTPTSEQVVPVSSDTSGSSSSGSSSSDSSSSSSSSGSSSDSSDSETETPVVNGNQHADKQDGGDDSEPELPVGNGSVAVQESGEERSRSPSPPSAQWSRDFRAASLSESENESPDKSVQCNVCRKWFSTIVTLKIHRRVHMSRAAGGGSTRAGRDRYECDICAGVFSRRERLLEHKATVHRGSMTVRCEVCRKCFEDDAELTAHTATHTQDEREGRCPVCASVFPRYELLRRHVTTAHAAPANTSSHACDTCGKTFTHAHSLTRHLHNHARQLFRCVVCKASFARAEQLAQHLNSHLANYKRLKS